MLIFGLVDFVVCIVVVLCEVLVGVLIVLIGVLYLLGLLIFEGCCVWCVG